MDVFSISLSITLGLILIIITAELFAPKTVLEGFSSLPYWGKFVSSRADIGPGLEDPQYIRDIRYFKGYKDVSRLGVEYDFCRMISPKGDETDLFFACALAGTENLSSTSFRTASVSNGFRVSRDDYMRDINKDGRADYCRILQYKDNTYQPLCQRAGDIGFEAKDVIDPSPPSDIATLLSFYEGCVIWLRLKDDMVDMIDSVNVQTAGGISVNELPAETTEGLSFNGVNQYLRLSDSNDLTLGTIVPIRSIRSWMMWAKFDEFTNNAKLFDFGNGSGQDNVFLGIFGKGDSQVNSGEESTVVASSGQQAVEEITPQELLKRTDANVDQYECPGFEVFPRKLPHSTIGTNTVNTKKATLVYEVWDKKMRKLRMKVNSAIPLGIWTHIVITVNDSDAFRPTLAVYINAKNVYEKEGGFLPSTGSMTNCYIGKSNWLTEAQYTNKDEPFKGSMFDFRVYQKGLSEQLIQDSYDWGKSNLGLQ
jgi:hypothetical protein